MVDGIAATDPSRVYDAYALTEQGSVSLADIAHVNMNTRITAVDRVRTRDQRRGRMNWSVRTQDSLAVEDQLPCVDNIGYVMETHGGVALEDKASATEVLTRTMKDGFSIAEKLKMSGGRLLRVRNPRIQIIGRGRNTRYVIFGR